MDNEYSQKANSLLNTIDEHLDSQIVNQYWNGVKVQNEQDESRVKQLVLQEKKVSIYALNALCIITNFL